MRRSMMLLGSAALALAACGSANSASRNAVAASGSGNARSFAASGFDRVALEGPDDVIVRSGTAFSVRAEGPSDTLDKLEISVDDGLLRIGRKHHSGISFSSDEGVRVTVTLPALHGASVAGSGDLDIDRASGDRFKASIAGSGNLGIGALATDAASLTVAGSGDLTVAGRARSTDVSIAGSGNVDASRLTGETADISIAGSGNAHVNATREAKVSLVGSGDAVVTGTRNCRVSKLGSGDARCGS